MTTAFNKLARPIQKWIRQNGWQELRYIQSEAIHAVMDSDDDLIISAATASGKTEAAFLPLISQLIEVPPENTGFDLVYVGPLKALITDQTDRLQSICDELGVSVTPWHGDVSSGIKGKALKAPKGILLITPESIEAMFVRRSEQIPKLFSSTRAFIIDELHAMLDSERGMHLRSLLSRIELGVGKKIRRVGLSATLGHLELAKACLRPGNEDAVRVIEAKGGESALHLQVRAYLPDYDNEGEAAATALIAKHLFEHLRGTDNLIFAGSRQSVELYADQLRTLCEEEKLPQEFYPHHASLSREHRSFVEERLKDKSLPTTAVCTSTLELGLDIGDVSCIAQIGAPYSVSSLRQRLGRSGRRPGQPAVLRQYVVEGKISPKSNFFDRLHLGLIRSIAMIDLLLDGWCEPPEPRALNLSVLVHQILSIIAERGGASAKGLYQTLAIAGPFKNVTQEILMEVLTALAKPGVDLIEQDGRGLLLLGKTGERLVSSYGFYPVFWTQKEYRLVCDGKNLGSLPVNQLLELGMLLIFSGRRWEIIEINDRDRVISVQPAKHGIPPFSGSNLGHIHDAVIQRLFQVLEEDTDKVYLDSTARDLLAEARDAFRQLGLHQASVISLDSKTAALATRVGTVKSNTLAFALRTYGFTIESHDGFLCVRTTRHIDELWSALRQLAEGEAFDVFAHHPNLIFERFHGYLSPELLRLDTLSSRLDTGVMPSLASAILGHHHGTSPDMV